MLNNFNTNQNKCPNLEKKHQSKRLEFVESEECFATSYLNSAVINDLAHVYREPNRYSVQNRKLNLK